MAHNYLVDLMNMDAEELLDNMIQYTPKKGKGNMNKKTLYAVKRGSASRTIDYNYWPSHHKTMFIGETKGECKEFIENMPDDMWFDRKGRQYHFYIDTLTKEEM